MNRRSLLLLSTLIGGLWPARLLAQEAGRRAPVRSARARRPGEAERTARGSSRDEDVPADNPEADPDPAAIRDEIPPNLPSEPGQQWRTFDIAGYTSLPHEDGSPQSSIVDWIFRRTKTAPWHGDKIAVLSAGRTKIRAYNSKTILDQVGEVVERFTDAVADRLTVRVRFVTTADTRWRYPIYKSLKLVGSGPQGQQIWSLASDESAMVLTQMQVWQGFTLLADRQFSIVNGQTFQMTTSSPRPYTGGLQRDSAVGQGFQPKTEQLEEGVTLRLSPLLSFEGDTLDAAIELTTNTVRSFHQTRVLAPREVGPGELKIDVPEVSETRLNQTVKGWGLGQTLLISAGIQPGILHAKGGLFNMKIPGTTPTSTELLVFLEAAIAKEPESRRGEGSRSRR